MTANLQRKNDRLLYTVPHGTHENKIKYLLFKFASER